MSSSSSLVSSIFCVSFLFVRSSSKEDFCQIWQDSGHVFFLAAIPHARALTAISPNTHGFCPSPATLRMHLSISSSCTTKRSWLTTSLAAFVKERKVEGTRATKKLHHKLAIHGWGQRLKSSLFCHCKWLKHWLHDILFIDVFFVVTLRCVRYFSKGEAPPKYDKQLCSTVHSWIEFFCDTVLSWVYAAWTVSLSMVPHIEVYTCHI